MVFQFIGLIIFSSIYFLSAVFSTAYAQSYFAPACRNTTNSNFSSCFNTTATPSKSSCALVIDQDTNEIKTDNVFCNTGGSGICKYNNISLNCSQSNNPVQAAVDATSILNQPLSRTKYEVFLEPGEFTVTQTCYDGASNPDCSGFVHNKNGQILRNIFGQDRFMVQIPSYTKISGQINENLQQSIVFVPESVYDAWGNDFVYATAGQKGQGVTSLFTLTNILAEVSIDPIQEKANLYDPSMANPVHDVTIQNISMLGVGGPERKIQNQATEQSKCHPSNSALCQWRPPGYYCTEEPCFYRYTVMNGISGKRLSGGHIKILSNRFELFPAFIVLGHFFNMQTPSFPQDLLGDGFITQLRADGTTDDRIQIANNYMNGAIGADSVIVWGSYIDIIGNTIKNGYSDWYGNQIAISPYTDSKFVTMANNIIDRYLLGVDLEGLFPPPAASTVNWDEKMKSTSQIAEGNIIRNNTFNNVLACFSIQRQSGTQVYDNTCNFDQTKWEKLIQRNYYSPPDKYQFISNMVGRQITQSEAQDWNTSIQGFGVHIRTSKNLLIYRNIFNLYPKGILLDNLDILEGGMQNNEFNNNSYFISGEQAQYDIALAQSQGVFDYFYSIFWFPEPSQLSSNNKFCLNNQFPYPLVTGRLYSNPDYPGQIKDATCNLPIIPSPAPSPSPQPTPVYTCENNLGQCVAVSYTCVPPGTVQGTCPLAQKCVSEAATCHPPAIPSPSPSFTTADLKNLLINYTNPSNGAYLPVDNKINMLDASWVIKWLSF